MTLDESQQVEDLLLAWHRWQDAYRPALGAPRCDPACRDYRSSDMRLTEKEQDELTDVKIWKANSEKVEACIDGLPSWQHRSAIQMSMANKRIGRDVFSNPRIPKDEAHALYQEAKELLFPKFFARGLIKLAPLEENL